MIANYKPLPLLTDFLHFRMLCSGISHHLHITNIVPQKYGFRKGMCIANVAYKLTEYSDLSAKQDRDCMYNITSRCIHATTALRVRL
jgi:hypothetical protein